MKILRSRYKCLRYLAAATVLCALSSQTVADESNPSATKPDVWQNLAALQFPATTKIPFSETRKTRLHRKPKTQSGHLWLSDAGDFVMLIELPREEERRLSGTQLSLTRNGKTRSTQLDPSRGAHQLLLAVVDIMQGNTDRLRQDFSVQADSPSADNAAGWSWSLTPKSESMRREMSQLTLRGRANSLTSLRAERGRSWQQIQILGSNLPQP